MPGLPMLEAAVAYFMHRSCNGDIVGSTILCALVYSFMLHETNKAHVASKIDMVTGIICLP